MMRSIYEFIMRILCQPECALARGFNASSGLWLLYVHINGGGE